MTVTAIPDLSSHRFAISGSSGFLGQHLIRVLKRHRAQIILLLRPDGPPIDDPTIEQRQIDFTCEESCAASLSDVQPTQLIHLAGYANTDRSLASVTHALQINLGATINLIMGAMDKVPECRVVLAGSLEHASPWREPLKLGSPYGMSKAMVEVLSGSLNLLYDANVLNMRIGMAYGEYDPKTRRIVPSVILSLLAGESPAISSTTRLCDWIHAEDVAEALILGSLLPRAEPSSIDVGWGLLASIGDMIDIVRDIIGTDIKPTVSSEMARQHEQGRCADIVATQAALGGWFPRIDLRQGLTRTIDWYRQQQAGRNGDRP
ncbi:MAG: NAD(P)-dependent oxidoreductase [Lautropia sp.]|nr:NAD(P)-dependent oxidoreductase [Lautropia sp.]